MKLMLIFPIALSLIAMPLFADDDDSTLKKAAKLKVYQESDDDSLLKKGAGLKATGEILGDDGDSTLMKATKMKVLKEASDKGDGD
jgi:hypothetical protein